MTPDHGSDRVASGFPALLRRYRRAAGLTQTELAERAAVGVRTVRDLERGRSSRPQRTTVELLATALGLTGPARTEFLAAARGPAAGTTGGAVRRRPSGAGLGLPEPVHLIGRDRDLAELTPMVVPGPQAVPGVVSLVGLAGVGKTSLALTVARRLRNRYPGGANGIMVTEDSTESDILSAVATVFGVGRASDLAHRLSGAPSLLLVDAVERAPGATAGAVHRLAAVAPALRIVATGRHPVGLPGERVWPVTPLEVPPADAPADLAVVADYPAVALFLARLRQVRREPPEPDEVKALVELVRRLGGLPFALELAAAHGRLLNLNEILDRYGNRVLDLATPPVTRAALGVTLRDAVAASYRLLGPADQAALRRLSVLRNRWSVELAEAMLTGWRSGERPARRASGPAGVPDPEPPATPAGEPTPATSPSREEPAPVGCAGEADPGDDPVPVLDRLMELGLISARGTGPLRFRLLDVVRDFALERAAADGELAAIRRRHASVFADFAARLAPDLAGAKFLEVVGLLDEVTADLWAALAHAANDDPHTALRLAAQLTRWWRYRGRDVAGRQWLRRLLDDPATADADPAIRAWAAVGVAQLAQEHGAGPEELAAAEQALTEFARLGDVVGELAARNVLCGLWTAVGGYDEARRHGEAALALATRSGRIRDMAVAQNNLTWHEIRTADLRAARRRLAAVDRLAGQCGEERLRVLARANLAEVARLEGRYADAVRQGRYAVRALADLGDPGHRRRALGTVGLALAQDGRLDEAAAVLAELRAQQAAEEVAGTAEPVSTRRPGGAIPRDEGICALIEATLAAQRGDREWAAEWFAAAAQSSVGARDLRDVAEALVGVVATADDPGTRASARKLLDRVCESGGITLLPRERAMIDPVG
ncbi:helix-turn-helix domain-containing protein [Micromonospora sp. HM5-17]|jgi:predicted ATPase/transcriptional regulator with XRE-family HTH domain|uniref:ATP-binding protein n=1 Tax=Micromonospora sp. HM5-17 TaxID=2487710 RepID=UPI000F47FD98|nr:helix-turn-helix domain-containing protein [Micromonospora sp. HM5-17]ROT33579.1 helix-turn-helix domain-containing protein [Micromonospora sp. HM5-17]